MASTLPRLPIFEAIAKHDLSRTAVVHNPSGRAFTYGELAHDVADATEELRAKAGEKSLDGERIAFLVENGYDYIGTPLTLDTSEIAQWILIVSSHTSLYFRE
jgi:malonyl-CoA/methylmalonyl-CoA synthetase